MSSTNGKYDADMGPRVMHVEAEQVLLRRDLTALIATSREICDRISELSGAVATIGSKLDLLFGRTDVITDAIAHLARKRSQKTTRRKK